MDRANIVIRFKATQDQDDAIKEACRILEIDQTELIRRALSDYFERTAHLPNFPMHSIKKGVKKKTAK